jgi:hypothetical protein
MPQKQATYKGSETDGMGPPPVAHVDVSPAGCRPMGFLHGSFFPSLPPPPPPVPGMPSHGDSSFPGTTSPGRACSLKPLGQGGLIHPDEMAVWRLELEAAEAGQQDVALCSVVTLIYQLLRTADNGARDRTPRLTSP